MTIDIEELRNLPNSEKLRLVELLWDDLGASNAPIVLHDWQFNEARRRLNEMKNDSSVTIDRDELWRRVHG
jgi:putative addiction module component (TIGR02574 family)